MPDLAAGINLRRLHQARILQGRGEIAAMIGSFAVLRAVEVLHSPVSYRDTASYLDLSFIGEAKRLWTVPLVWTVVPSDAGRELVQLGLGVIS